MDDCELKLPHIIPQDLLLIQDIVATTPSIAFEIQKGHEDTTDDDSIASTDNEVDSEEEVEADLVLDEERHAIKVDVVAAHPSTDSISDSGSDSDSGSSTGSDSDVEPASKDSKPSTSHEYVSDVENDESGVVEEAGYLHTKNEIFDADIIVPKDSEVSPDDVLEKVGEVMSIVGNTVIVKGLTADNSRSLAKRALDVDTLFVFGDRKILGYVYETFGPTSQPLYQIKFNQRYPLDSEKIRVSRDVFHVPRKSKYVFVDMIKKMRGSDASNVHDEEPADDELEFSDDEKEAAFKQQRKRKRQQSIILSRQTTPVAPPVHADSVGDEIFYGSNPYDAHGPYDDGYCVAGPSRQAPMPYDDPYAEHPPPDTTDQERDESVPTAQSQGWHPSSERRSFEPRRRGRGHRGRGHGREGRGHRGRMLRGRPGHYPSGSTPQEATGHDMNRPQTSAPNRFEAADAEHFADGALAHSQPSPMSWYYQPSGNTQFQQDYSPPVQPHINPRFASAFGITLPGSVGQWNSQEATSYYMPQSQGGWGVPWPMPGDGDAYTPM